MLSRMAQASRLSLVARMSRPVASPTLRARPAPAPAALSPWIRSYASKKNRSDRSQQSQPKPSTDKPSSDAQQKDNLRPTEGEAAEQKDPATKDEEQIAFDKLPDLTQGIPSTLEYEMEKTSKKEKKSQSTIQETDLTESTSGGRERRERPDSYVSTSERNRSWWTKFMLGASVAGATGGFFYMGRDWDPVEAERYVNVPNTPGPAGLWTRVKTRMTESVSYYQEPAFEKLLPDPDPSFERPYTLCISLDDLLVHSEWTRDHGWRLAKRPGVDYFIRYLSQYYELVLFTTVPFGTAEPLVRKLDPFRFIMWPLYREATKFQDGEVVKDLSYLNRDLSKVIIIDTNPKHVRNQPENAIVLKPWKGSPDDKDLVGLIPFLEYIHTMQYSDVRKVLKSFDGQHIPTEFARREAIARKEFHARQLINDKSRKHSSGVGALGSMLGLNPSNMSMTVNPDGEQNPSEAFAQGKMLQDIARERGQRNYELLEREIRENGEKWLKEEAEMMEKAQKEAMNSMMGSFSGIFGSGGGGSETAEKRP
ncbi:Mitochondrial import inner membrane translocase subunit TIM50 [Neonectria ditissima]|uniref:Mitochondrial import inner membrane translocase subunit TIM50 n=1 Tax=Neonectria ditissima TaxID=78410 RepID=A0A0P7B3A2_9HYPO|nr:Mitochondrial import inner membrane translocase subunit TIM50 [Neonectria ditissima]